VPVAQILCKSLVFMQPKVHHRTPEVSHDLKPTQMSSISFHLHLWFFPYDFQAEISTRFNRNDSTPSHPHTRGPRKTRWTVQVTNLLVQLSPSSCCTVSLRSKHPPLPPPPPAPYSQTARSVLNVRMFVMYCTVYKGCYNIKQYDITEM